MFTELSTDVRCRLTKYDHETYSDRLSGGFARGLDDAESAEGAPNLAQHELTHVKLSQRTLLVTDAASDLPAEWRAKAGVLLLPIKLRIGKISRVDNGDEATAVHFAAQLLAQLDGPTPTLAASAERTGELIGQHTIDDTDFVLQIAMSSMRSNSYANSLTAAQKLMVKSSRDRRRAGNTRPFKMWVVDSGTSFNGHGVLIAECARLLQADVALPQTVQQVDALRREVKTLVIPRDLKRFHRCAALPQSPFAHWLSRSFGQLFNRIPVVVASADELRIMSTQYGFTVAASVAFNQVIRCVEAGIAAPFVCASYAGDIADLRHIDGFVELSATCARHAVTLLTSAMSMTNAAMLGGGSVLISLASSFEFE